MAYMPGAVANELLDLAAASGKKLTQIDIQKLVYFAHGWYMALKKQPLVGEQILAWQYGPVIRSLYDEFREFGGRPITSRAMEWEMTDDFRFEKEPAILSSDNEAEDLYAKAVIQTVWGKYGMMGPFELVEQTHLPDGPWAQTFQAGHRIIPNEKIQSYFEKLLAPDTA